MKTAQAFFSLVVAAFFATAFMAPPGNLIVRMKAGEEGKTISVQLANLEGARTELSIIGVDGTPWHSQYIWNRNGYTAGLDLTLLEPEDYIIQVTNRNGAARGVFTLGDESVNFFQPRSVSDPKETGKAVAAFASYRTRDGRLIARFQPAAETGKLDVQLANLLNRPVTLYITALKGIPVYAEHIDGVSGINRRMDLNGMGDGGYFLYLKTANATVVQFFRLRSGAIELMETVGRDAGAAIRPAAEIVTYNM